MKEKEKFCDVSIFLLRTGQKTRDAAVFESQIIPLAIPID